MNKLGKKYLSISILFVVFSLAACGQEDQFEEGPMDISLMAYAGITIDSEMKFVIYDAEDHELVWDESEMVEALKLIHLTYRYRPDVDAQEAYGMMDIGNGMDTVKRVRLIGAESIAIGKDYFIITGGEDLKALVEE